MDGRCYLLREFGTICYMPMWSKWKDLNTVPIIRAVPRGVTRGLTHGGGSHNAPFNPYTYVRIEVDGLYVSLNHPNVHGTCVAWGLKKGLFHLRDFRPSRLAFWTFLLLDLLLPLLVFCICAFATPIATHHFLQLHCSSWSYFSVPCLDKWMPLLDIAYDFLGVKWTLQGPECRALVLSLEKVVIIRERPVAFLKSSCCGGMGEGKGGVLGLMWPRASVCQQDGTLLLLVWLLNAKKSADGVQYPRHDLPSGPLLIRGKKKTGRLVEWVEKASFDRLNKLFMISTMSGIIKPL
ncbi:hypothetical protein CK203_026557 [Vitis vinifera]|uniref:Uncharacterized protein n=1 Tax=Vitis vinifera TaxID=29760 RepID=A0A438IVU0_VITVI|nr:hypothetical protein CK203_026557 [Vitis vinifera]